MLDDKKYSELLENILHKGLKKYSSDSIVPFGYKESEDKKGKVFGYFSKRDLIRGTGTIYHSLQHLLSTYELLSHWTPNIFSYGKYGENNIVSGHFERNLVQINTFVVDLDFHNINDKVALKKLISVLVDMDLLPTMILNTPKGYHLYFVINNKDTKTGEYTKPSYISSANDYKSLDVAKRISENIRLRINQVLPFVDLGCNHFGVFRYPTRENILHYDQNSTKTFEGYLEWSIKVEKQNNWSTSARKLSVAGQRNIRQVETKWFRLLANVKSYDSSYGYGRNHAVYTLSLACKQSEIGLNDCIDMMDEFNSALNNPLRDKEVVSCVKGAYRNDKQGASRKFVNYLLEAYAPDSPVTFDDITLTNNRGWYKFKKAREDRKYSHDSESIEDLLAFVEANQQEDLHIQFTLPEISNKTGIPLSSLKRILNKLQENRVIHRKVTRGRNGSTRIALTSQLNKQLVISYLLKKGSMASITADLPDLTEEEHKTVKVILEAYRTETMTEKERNKRLIHYQMSISS
ncbi:primase C-terminal domain-containing protein [Vagococcus sp.]|uniref:Primase C-terminal 1 domain-containing protein n=2 Tax=Vagococcus fluvialis TaxID=2738 RepID=A0A1X6WU06_9ENTE|nr:primase C-terminal domain-containing protein [Vagococcus sp.]SLM87106.1 hypothetical protein FM121_13490 [Vagococcus fluvialis bH819]HCM90613.1 hypothetical protein [Vagococcus sp.]